MSRLTLRALQRQTALLRPTVSPLPFLTAFRPLRAAPAPGFWNKTISSTFSGRSHSTKRPPQIHYSEEVLAATREIERLVQQNSRTYAAPTEKNDPATQKIATKSCHIAPCKAPETNFQSLSATVSTPHSTAIDAEYQSHPTLEPKTSPTTSPHTASATNPKESDPPLKTPEITNSNVKKPTAEQKFMSITSVVGITFLLGLPIAYVLGLPLDLFIYNACQPLLTFILITVLR